MRRSCRCKRVRWQDGILVTTWTDFQVMVKLRQKKRCRQQTVNPKNTLSYRIAARFLRTGRLFLCLAARISRAFTFADAITGHKAGKAKAQHWGRLSLACIWMAWPHGKRWFACIWYNIGIDRWKNERYWTKLFPVQAGVFLWWCSFPCLRPCIPRVSGGGPMHMSDCLGG